MRVIFMGTPEFGVPIFNRILNSRHYIIAAVCQPDREGNRRQICVSPVKQCAQCNDIKVLQYNRISREGIDELRQLNADIMVTAAFGQILSDEVLNLTEHGVINVHASLLPLYRGSSPIQHAILNGEKVTGITIMQTRREVDSGEMMMQKELSISENETAGELSIRLSKLGAEMIIEALDNIEAGRAIFTPQDHSKATYYPMLKKSDGRINYDKTAYEFLNHIRAMNPWPSAYTLINNSQVKVIKASAYNLNSKQAEIGEVVLSNPKEGLVVKVTDGHIKLDIIKPEGKKEIRIEDYLLGNPVKIGTKLC